MTKQTGRIALCGMLCGLSVMIIMLSAVFQSLSYVIPMVAGALLIVPVIEYGTGTALTTYVATGLLSIILLQTDGPVMYILLFGLYPILKNLFERIPKRFLEYLCKFAYFNIAAACALLIINYVLKLPLDMDGMLDPWLVPALLVVGNITFFLYDWTLTLALTLYLRRLQAPLRKAMHIK